MSEIKERCITIVLVGIVAIAVIAAWNYHKPFKVYSNGGLFSFRYNVEIPQKYMTKELAERHHEAFLLMMDKQFSNKGESK